MVAFCKDMTIYTRRKRKKPHKEAFRIWLRGKDSNQRPSGYEPDELPDCSTPLILIIAKKNFIVKTF